MILNAALDRAIIEGYTQKRDPVSLLAPLGKALYDKALSGDVPAIRECLDRVDGPVLRDGDGSGGGVTVQILNLLTQTSAGSGLSQALEQIPQDTPSGAVLTVHASRVIDSA